MKLKILKIDDNLSTVCKHDINQSDKSDKFDEPEININIHIPSNPEDNDNQDSVSLFND